MALLTFPAFPSTPSGNKDHFSEKKELKILSWNIFMMPDISLFNNNGERAKVIAYILQSSGYQVIVFQEAFSYKCRIILAESLTKRYPSSFYSLFTVCVTKITIEQFAILYVVTYKGET